ncbi:UPF0606 protein KIAA1549L homolog isoform X3 [Ascaphus truei]|uniref:UPF0606 protein KIAA1549L homolog isoform X3 n=1 Tax=Ascaphus truei TaxID=8439 RepID=UPI003F5A4619
MAPAGKWPGDEDPWVHAMVTPSVGRIGVKTRGCHEPSLTPSAKWTRSPALLLLLAVTLALLQHVHALNDSSTHQSDRNMSTRESFTPSPIWPSKEVQSSSTANGVMNTVTQVLENDTFFKILTTLTSKNTKTNEMTPASYIQENATMSLADFNSSSESSPQPADKTAATSGLNETSIFSTSHPLSSLTYTETALSFQSTSSYPPTISRQSSPGPNILIHSSSSSSSSSASSPPPSSSLSSTSVSDMPYGVISSTNVPFSDSTINGIHLGSTSEVSTINVTNPSLNATSNPSAIQTTSTLEKSRTDRTTLTVENTTPETALYRPSKSPSTVTLTSFTSMDNSKLQNPSTNPSLNATNNVLIVQTSSTMEISNIGRTQLPMENPTPETFQSLPSESLVTNATFNKISLYSLSTSQPETDQPPASSVTESISTTQTGGLQSKATNVTGFMDAGSTTTETKETSSYTSYTDVSTSTAFLITETTDDHNTTNASPSTEYTPTLNSYTSTDVGVKEKSSETVLTSRPLITMNINSNADTANSISTAPVFTVSPETDSLQTQQTDISIFTTSNNMELTTTMYKDALDSQPITEAGRTGGTPEITQTRFEMATLTSPSATSSSQPFASTLQGFTSSIVEHSTAINPYTTTGSATTPYISEESTVVSATQTGHSRSSSSLPLEYTTSHFDESRSSFDFDTDSSTIKPTPSSEVTSSSATSNGNASNTPPNAMLSTIYITINTAMSDAISPVIRDTSTLFTSQPSARTTAKMPTGTAMSDWTPTGTGIYNINIKTENLQTNSHSKNISTTSHSDMESYTHTGDMSSHQYISSETTTIPISQPSQDIENGTEHSSSSTNFTPSSGVTGSQGILSSSNSPSTNSLLSSTLSSLTPTEKHEYLNESSAASTENSPTIITSLSPQSPFNQTSDQPQESTSSPTESHNSPLSMTTSILTFATNSEMSSIQPITFATTTVSLVLTSTAEEHSAYSTIEQADISTSTVNTHLSTVITSEMWHSNGLPVGNSTNEVVTAVPTFPTITHLPLSPITPAHSSPTPHTSATFPTNISNSVFTVSSSVSAGGVSIGPPTENVTRNSSSISTMPTSLSSETHTMSTSHMPPLTTSTPESTIHTETTTHTSTTRVVTETATNTHPLATVTLPTTILSTATMSPVTTTHAPNTIKTVPTTVNATNPVTMKTSTFTPALTSVTISAKTVGGTTVPNTTAVDSTIATTTFSPPTSTPFALECKLSSETMVKTVLTLSLQLTRSEMDSLKQNLSGALKQTLDQALKQPIQVHINDSSLNTTSQNSNNVTVGYSISVNSSVYIPSAITEVLLANDVVYITNLKRRLPSLQYVPVLAAPWELLPGYTFRLKTVLKLMGTGGNIHSCRYTRSMEQRLQTAFEKAAVTGSNFTVQILSTSQVEQILTLIYAVKNRGILQNGSTSSNLLNRLTGEVVGYYLGDPPLIIAEALYFPSIDISDSTVNSWVITVILGVDNTLLGINNQSFARLMEERLAQLFQLSHRQTRRFKRATTIETYTVQMVKMQRVEGLNNPAELTYYALMNGTPIPGIVAAKQLSTIDPQTMALTLGYIVRMQADPVVKNPPNNMWIIAAVLAPIAVVTVIIIIITAVLCRKNKGDFKSENMANMPPRTKPVQGFDYAKQHLGQQGADEEVVPVTQETVVPSLNLSQERDGTQDGSTKTMLKSSETRKSQSPSENGSVISNESGSDGSTPQGGTAQRKVTTEAARRRNGFIKQTRKIVPISDEEEGSMIFDKNTKTVTEPFNSSSGSVQLMAIKPVAGSPSQGQESAIINGEVNKALKQKSDIEHYRNKLRLKAKRKGYYDFPPVDKSLTERKRKMYEKTQKEIDNVLDVDTDASSPFAEPNNRQPSLQNQPYRSRQSLNSPSPGETEMDLLVTRERPRRGIRNSGYDTEPEIIEETNVDRVKQARTYIKSRQAKGHSATSTLSSQPSIDEVRQQMHMLLEEAFSLASAGHGGPKRQPPDSYASMQHMPYSEVVTSAPGTMSRPRGGVQWVPTYGPEMYQYSLPRPAYRFSQLPEMVMGSPPPPVPPRTGPVAVASLRRSTSDMANKTKIPEPGGNEQAQGNSVPAVFAIPGNRAGYSGYFMPQPPTSYRNQAWMSYTGDNDLPGQWADSVPLPGYIEAYPRSRYPQSSPSRLPRQFNQPVNMHPSLEHAAGPSIGASQQSLAETDTPDPSITNLSTAALVKAIREEVAKLAKKQTDRFEFQV